MNRRACKSGDAELAQGVYSLRRIDPYNHFFYDSADSAREAAGEAAEMKEPFPAMEILQLPSPSMNFVATALDMFAVFSPCAASEGRIAYANSIGEADLYDADNLSHTSLGRLNAPKGFKVSNPCACPSRTLAPTATACMSWTGTLGRALVSASRSSSPCPCAES